MAAHPHFKSFVADIHFNDWFARYGKIGSLILKELSFSP
jgi:hypothetical protein